MEKKGRVFRYSPRASAPFDLKDLHASTPRDGVCGERGSGEVDDDRCGQSWAGILDPIELVKIATGLGRPEDQGTTLENSGHQH